MKSLLSSFASVQWKRVGLEAVDDEGCLNLKHRPTV
ncbi:hypothetical protein SLEP1_g28004 [Rubroshorea leprosula]|uniref:Uncharacterized protein n=1 Tax=Rubroshorea leprosula TaxID=152421 RepID=A0AAV5K1L5_9ROSI|nr:hypothetical protein SLEP1_g28004 [Rubroshorea leprosula]